jgi:hypothetical protein
LKHEPTKKLVVEIVKFVRQYVEAMEKVIEITGQYSVMQLEAAPCPLFF